MISCLAQEVVRVGYLESLKINTKHAGDNDYLGELYLQTKRPEEAKKRLEVLKTCNCEEYK